MALRYASALLLFDSSWPGPLTFLQHNRVAQHDAVSKATARLNQLRTATVKSAAAEEGNALIESHESLPLEVHPVYVNYLRMQAAGIDPAVIRERMVRGVWCVAARQERFPHECGHWPRTMQAADSPNPKVVHWSPTTLVELQDAAGVESHVPASRHPLYVRRVLSGYRLARVSPWVLAHPLCGACRCCNLAAHRYKEYFDMISFGVPPSVVEYKMRQRRCVPAFLNVDPATPVAVARRLTSRSSVRARPTATSSSSPSPARHAQAPQTPARTDNNTGGAPTSGADAAGDNVLGPEFEEALQVVAALPDVRVRWWCGVRSCGMVTKY